MAEEKVEEQVEQPEVEQPEVEQPKAEQPEVEQPEVEQPKVEQPEVEQPEVEQPKVEQPEVEQPKVEQPKAEQPVVEQPEGHYYYGTGRRKSAVARVRLYAGSGTIIVNGKPFEDVFNRPLYDSVVRRPLVVTETADKFNIQVKIAGGGITGWASAIAHGIARALLAASEQYKPILRKAGLLTRDARVKERKKYGLKRARKAPQYTKR